MNNNEGLEYVSSSPMLDVDTVKKPKDERDIRTLEVVLDLIKNRMVYYQTIDSLSAKEEELTVKQQLVVNKHIVRHIGELQSLITNAIEEVENGRER